MSEFLEIAKKAARASGQLLKDNYGKDKVVDAFEEHDIKLQLDVMSQSIISDLISEAFPDHSILGEEGDAGSEAGDYQWIIDPIDGTVNYFFGIPHFCVSIALRQKSTDQWILGVIYDPMMDELWAVDVGSEPTLNLSLIHI